MKMWQLCYNHLQRMLKIGEEMINMMNIDNEINKHLNIYEIAQAVENVMGNIDYKFEIINNDLIVSDINDNTTITMLSNNFLKTHDLEDIIYNIKVAILIYEINIRFDNDCLDNEQIDAMLSIATGLIY